MKIDFKELKIGDFADEPDIEAIFMESEEYFAKEHPGLIQAFQTAVQQATEVGIYLNKIRLNMSKEILHTPLDELIRYNRVT